MVIDVVDLDFESLQFNKTYDSNRYKRGTSIYNKELVTIKRVNKIDEENCEISALVEGNYGIYETYLKINSS